MNAVTTEPGRLMQAVLDRVSSVVIGKREPLLDVLSAVLAGGHVLLEDVPGVGKTLAARTLAGCLGLTFGRVQFTPDMLPADLTGAVYFDQKRQEFTFRRGPVFTGLLLADEINRTPAKTQAALLQAMQEGHVSVEGTTYPLPRPFHVIATANPIEYEGTFPLPEAQLDRFHVRVRFGYPDPVDETALVRATLPAARHDAGSRRSDGDVPVVMSAEQLIDAQQAARTVTVADDLLRYVLDLVTATRTHDSLALGASPRASLALTHCAQAAALFRGRTYVVPSDVQRLAVPVLAHRLVLRPELWGSRVTPDGIVETILRTVPTPEGRQP